MTENSQIRKMAHLELASRAQTGAEHLDRRFNYEPMFFAHENVSSTEVNFLHFKLDFPLWISSMTGGTAEAFTINQNLSKLAGKYGLGLGLGSCRPLLESDERLRDFDLRNNTAGPLFANLGLAQVEELVLSNRSSTIHELVKRLQVDGLMIHINPLQEWFQPAGDRFKQSPLVTINRFLETSRYPIFVKEVGHGIGPKSLEALLSMGIAGIEFGAFGGTNFSKLEMLRSEGQVIKSNFINVGHSSEEMIEFLNSMTLGNKEFIISGGIKDPLDALYLQNKFKKKALIGMAHSFLAPARVSFESLEKYFLEFKEAYVYGKQLLEVKE